MSLRSDAEVFAILAGGIGVGGMFATIPFSPTLWVLPFAALALLSFGGLCVIQYREATDRLHRELDETRG